MARPRQGEGIKQTIVKRGEKYYAYEVTSVMVDGKKKTLSKYIGRVDPETNKVLEKIPEKTKASREKIAESKRLAVINDIKIADYGSVYLLDTIQKRIHLGDDLNASFGMISAELMAIAMSLVQTNGVFGSVEGLMNRSWVKEYYGLSGSFDSGTLSRRMKWLGQSAQANMESFFEHRIRRNNGLIAWDTTTIGCHSDMGGMAEYVVNNKDDEDLKQVKLGMATDIRGVPLMYRFYAGNVSDMDTVKLLSDDIERFGGCDPIFVMDRGFCSGWNLKYMLDSNKRFVVPATTASKAVKKLFTLFNSEKNVVDKRYKDRMYKVWETEIGIRKDEGRLRANGDQAYSFTHEDEEDHASEGKVKAFVCYDYKKYCDEMENHKIAVNDLKVFASNIDAKDPVQAFKRKAGKMMKHFNVTADGRKVIVTEKTNSESFQENRAGLFLMLTSEGIDWETMMQAYDARRLTEQGFDRKKGESGRFYTSDKDSMKGREFLRFIDLIIRCEISAEIREAKKENVMSVESVVSMSDCIQVREYQSTRVICEIDKKEREIFKTLNVPLPEEAVVNTYIFDPTVGLL